MKKAKLMLLGIGVFAIAGGAFALKASRTLEPNAYCNTVAVDGQACTAVSGATTYTAGEGVSYALDNDGANQPVITSFCTLDAAASCSAVVTIYTGGTE